jgi:hypothetical protein
MRLVTNPKKNQRKLCSICMVPDNKKSNFIHSFVISTGGKEKLIYICRECFDTLP